MPSNKRWCIEVSGRTSGQSWMQRHLFSTRKEASKFLIRYGGRFHYNWSSVKKVK